MYFKSTMTTIDDIIDTYIKFPESTYKHLKSDSILMQYVYEERKKK